MNPCNPTPDTVLVPQTYQVVQVPNGCVTTPPTAVPATTPALATSPITMARLSGPMTAPATGSQFVFTTVGASNFLRPGQLIWFPGQGYAEVYYVTGDSVTAKNLSLAQGVTFAAGQEFGFLPPMDGVILKNLLCNETCPCGTEEKATGILACKPSGPGVSRFFDDGVFRLASDDDLSEGGVSLLARHRTTGELLRVASRNGKTLVGEDGVWKYGSAGMRIQAPGSIHYKTGQTDQQTIFDLTGFAGFRAESRFVYLLLETNISALQGDGRIDLKIEDRRFCSSRVRGTSDELITDGDSNMIAIWVKIPEDKKITIKHDFTLLPGGSTFELIESRVSVMGWYD